MKPEQVVKMARIFKARKGDAVHTPDENIFAMNETSENLWKVLRKGDTPQAPKSFSLLRYCPLTLLAAYSSSILIGQSSFNSSCLKCVGKCGIFTCWFWRSFICKKITIFSVKLSKVCSLKHSGDDFTPS